ncbi:MAG: hypothetical protein ATN36_00320 [Epulopiscium sp. Nele67-Bin005]|nr:MAG: hypothetical protein ATN36_00320 [Epulopiscium sp. Nele67-Bin005]
MKKKLFLASLCILSCFGNITNTYATVGSYDPAIPEYTFSITTPYSQVENIEEYPVVEGLNCECGGEVHLLDTTPTLWLFTGVENCTHNRYDKYHQNYERLVDQQVQCASCGGTGHSTHYETKWECYNIIYRRETYQ